MACGHNVRVRLDRFIVLYCAAFPKTRSRAVGFAPLHSVRRICQILSASCIFVSIASALCAEWIRGFSLLLAESIRSPVVADSGDARQKVALATVSSKIFKLLPCAPAGQVRMIAAHAWDVGEAMRAGCVAAFIARPGKAAFPLFPKPDVTGNDLGEVADAILRAELSSSR